MSTKQKQDHAQRAVVITPVSTVTNKDGDLRVLFFQRKPFLRVVVERRATDGTWHETNTVADVVLARAEVRHVQRSFELLDDKICQADVS